MKKLLFAVVVLAMAVPVMAADLASDATYKAKCAACHGAKGEGKAAMKTSAFKDAAAKMTEADLVKVITDGKGKMPAYKGKLSDAEIKTLAAEIKAAK
ncbi:MAG: cytochrome c [Terriglobales bacterium]